MSEVTADIAAEAAEAAAQPPPPKPKAGTEYLILVLYDPKGGHWVEGEKVNASSAKAAIRQHLGDGADVDGTYVAVPARSWQPLTVKTETQTKITLT